MIVSFPYTNPIIFSKCDEYHNYQDAYKHEEKGCFIQPFATGDLISFQVQWKLRKKTTRHYIKIDIVINGVRSFYRNYSLINAMTCGTYYSSYCKQEIYKYFYAKGYYVFSNKIESIIDVQNNQMLSVGDKFYFIVTADNVEYESNQLEYIADTSETKLLHYNNSSSIVFDTEFSAIQKGYDIRLPGCFLHPKPGSKKEVFESYQRDLEIITAQPFENIELEIGKTRGIPDWFVKNLNYIFHCDQKTIDGVEYELTTSAAIEPEYVQGYNFSWLKIEMAKRKNTMSYVSGIADRNIIGGVVITPFVSLELEKVPSHEISLVYIESTRHWYLGDGGNGILLEFEISQISGVGSAQIQIRAKHNLTDSDRTYTLYIIDAKTDAVIDNITLTQKPHKKGIGFGTVGDTLFVNEKPLIN